MWWCVDDQELGFQTTKRSDMCCAEVKGRLYADCQEWFSGSEKVWYEQCYPARESFADAHESCFQAAYRSNMGNTVLQGCQLPNSQQLCFQAAKRSDMSSAILQVGRFADAQESLLKVGNVHIWLVPSFKLFDLLMFRYCVLILQNVQIFAVPKWKGVYLPIVRNGVCSLRNG